MLSFLHSLIPQKLLEFVRPLYHLFWSFMSALWYRFPSRKIFVVGVTGTKGKSSTVELITAVLKAAGYTPASTSTIRFSLGEETERNMKKMTMPGRSFIQHFLFRAVKEKCDVAVLEMTSEGAKQNRHRFIDLDTLIFLNLSPEHIESHGSYENYKNAKLDLARSLSRSKKPVRTIIANADDAESPDFLAVDADRKRTFSLEAFEYYKETDEGISFVYKGEHFISSLRGRFNASNICAAIAFAESESIPLSAVKRAIASVDTIEGRVEEIHLSDAQPFSVYVDYAHTPDSLEKLYEAFTGSRLVCVLGNTGGGRDTWKRPEMGRIAEAHCDHIFLTNEDPYDEDPEKIVQEMKAGMKNADPVIQLDRRKAIREALRAAFANSDEHKNVVVLITGKGTDPYIMGPHGKRTPWSDATVVKEELRGILSGT